MPRLRLSLTALLVAVFVPVVSGTGLMVALVKTDRMERLTQQQVKQTLDQQAELVLSRWQDILDPRLTLAEFDLLELEESLLTQRDAAELPRLLPLFRSSLAKLPLVHSLFLGDEQGRMFRVTRREGIAKGKTTVEGKTRVQGKSDPAAAQIPLLVEILPSVGSADPPLSFHVDPDGRQLRPVASAPALNNHDPRTSSWYQRAKEGDGSPTVSDPLLLPWTQRMGVTLSRVFRDGGLVVGVSVHLRDLAQVLDGFQITPGTRLALVDNNGRVLLTKAGDQRSGEITAITTIESSRVPVLAALAPAVRQTLANPGKSNGSPQLQQMKLGNDSWFVSTQFVPSPFSNDEKVMVIAVPASELLAESQQVLRDSQVLVLLILLCSVPIVVLFARWISRSLDQLNREAAAIQTFDFDPVPPPSSPLGEVQDLGKVLSSMRDTIRSLLEASAALGGEPDLDHLLHRLLTLMLDSSRATCGVLYLRDESDQGRGVLRSRLQLPSTAFPMELSQDEIEDSCDTDKKLRLPLKSRDGLVLGVLELGFDQPPQADRVAFCTALAGSASTALETRSLISAQQALLASIIELMAGAIDAKSPYTGGHCARVPLLAKALADAACAATEGPYAGFSLSSEEQEALHVASWLHDVGKVTTPDHVVDKATKLETIHNRIHEVRMRFELLKASAEIDHWQAVASGADPDQSRMRMEHCWRQLDDDFKFVAACNEGGEQLPPESIRRLESIATRRWRRTIDDRLGVSEDERRQMAKEAVQSLPCEEPLLADRLRHQFAWPENKAIAPDNPWGFTLLPPPLQANRGELHNLRISRGTLTEEERYVINLHILETIKMLEALPFPRHLQAVPEIAGGHHERMDGKGYPRSLRGEDMSDLARMMAIADVFEALTAADRPYKPAKPLSVALSIMASMVQQHHLDPDLFSLFVRSGVYRRYAEECLRPEQCDDVDEEGLLMIATHTAP